MNHIRTIDFINPVRLTHSGHTRVGGTSMATSPSPVPLGTQQMTASSPAFLDRANPEAEIARAAAAYSNWVRWGDDDVLGTVNFITDDLRLGAGGRGRRGGGGPPSPRGR